MENNDTRSLEIQGLITRTWEMFKKNWAPLLINTGILFGIIYAIMLIIYLPGYLTGYICVGIGADDNTPLLIFGILVLLTTILVMTVLVMLASTALNNSLYRMALKGVKDETIDTKETILNGRKGLLKALICNILAAIIVTIGCLFCYLPGIYLSYRLMFVPILAAHHTNAGAFAILKRSWEMTSNHATVGLVFLAQFCINLVACFVSLLSLATTGFNALMTAEVYDLLGGNEPLDGEE